MNTLKRKGLFSVLVFFLFLAACSDVKVSEETKLTQSTLPKFIFEKDEFPPSAPGYIKVGETLGMKWQREVLNGE
ncbi:hypothetical protein ACFSO7_03500 [Bacillus sp. CGMCC 1.16607]|uniref:hypothetical protein n=1 Tax=Bacillus sp. CGMCC 1.16607 TaxID=3351842 RepID=UPI0036351DB1